MTTASDYIESARHMNQVHFTAKELAILWHMSEDFIHKTFDEEPGVIFHEIGKRPRMLIPESVALTVYNRRKKQVIV